jgi:hypothetical protein
MFQPSPEMIKVPEDDFRIEILRTIEKNKGLQYRVFASDKLDGNGQRIWEPIGTLDLQNPMLTLGVDQNLIFPHDSLKSSMTGKPLTMPTADPNNSQLPTDIH